MLFRMDVAMLFRMDAMLFRMEFCHVIQNGYEATMWRWYIKITVQSLNHESQNRNMAYLCRCELEKNFSLVDHHVDHLQMA